MSILRPETPIAELQAIDQKLRARLQKAGYLHLADLLSYYPRRYEDRGRFDAFPVCETGVAVCLQGYVCLLYTSDAADE